MIFRIEKVLSLEGPKYEKVSSYRKPEGLLFNGISLFKEVLNFSRILGGPGFARGPEERLLNRRP